MSSDPSLYPDSPIQRVAQPFQSFLHVEAASGLLLAACTVFALAAANSPWAAEWAAFWETRVVLGAGPLLLDYPLWYWVNNALMAIFFFLVGLEIKRELVLGELREPAARTLPVAAAIGGALLPAAIYLALQHQGDAARAWGVPMATDIAFVVGILALFGPRIPPGLKLFLLSLAIVDDLLAVVVIALFYAEGVSVTALGLGAALFLLMAAMRGLGVRSLLAYGVVGAGVWLCVLKSGVHPTIAGVALGLLTPARPLLPPPAVERLLRAARERLEGVTGKRRAALVRESSALLQEAVSPVERLESTLHPWVAFAIMPIFALANAGVPLSGDALASPVALSIAVALFLGKPLGILAAAAVAVRLGWAKLPVGVNWRLLGAGSCLAGIGFTMALFIAGLGMPAAQLTEGKTGVLLGSAAAAALGATLLMRAGRRHA